MSQGLAASEENAAVWMHMPAEPNQETMRSNFFSDKRKPVHQ